MAVSSYSDAFAGGLQSMLGRPAFRVTVSLLVLSAWLVPTAGLAAEEPPIPAADNVLDRPIVDVAIAPRSADAPMDLLTLSTDRQVPGVALVSVLRRDRTWAVIAEETIKVPADASDLATPRIVELGDGRYAVLSADVEARRTLISAVSVTGESEIDRPLVRGGATTDLRVTDAGAADVDGDGVAELILAGPAVPASGVACEDTAIEIRDGATLVRRSSYVVPDLRLEGGAIGDWDGQPGKDLLAYASIFASCRTSTDSSASVGLHAFRLRDGYPIVDLPRYESPGIPLGIPLAVDLDGDGWDEALAQDGTLLTMIDPSREWAMTSIGGQGAVALLAGTSTDPDAAGGRLAWIAPDQDGSLVVTMAGADRAPSGEIVVTPSASLQIPAGPSTRNDLGLLGMGEAVARQQTPHAWRGDLDGDDCPEVLAPLVTAECDGRRSLRAGALWLATRPLATFDVGAKRELLVAATIEWDPADGRLLAPSPSAASAPGAWRHGSSVRFVLSELRADDATYFATYPVPKPTIDRIAVREHATDVPGFTGARVLMRSTTARLEDRAPVVAPPLASFLSGSPAPGEQLSIARIAVPPGAGAGRDGSFVRVPLPDDVSGDAGSLEGWALTVTQLNDWGEIAPPVTGTVTRDRTGPSLHIDAPLLSAPWPWEASIHGRSETRARVRIGDGPAVETDRYGRFVVRTPLAPWPQTVQVTAVDQSGNSTLADVSVIGGVDYRAFPWPAIIAAALLLGALVWALRSGQGRVREVVPETGAGEPFPEIEDLPSGTGWQP